MLIEKYQEVLKEYVNNYFKILKIMYPSKNSTGFQERNQSVNFVNAYQKLNKNAVAWYEFQFGEDNRFHYDCVLVNPDEKEILIIESKRFDKLNKKIKEVYGDLIRINELEKIDGSELKDRIQEYSDYSLIGVILADVWTAKKDKKGESKKSLKQSFREKDKDKAFLKKYRDILNSALNIDDYNEEYFVKEIINKETINKEEFIVKDNDMNDDYSLLGIFWKVK